MKLLIDIGNTNTSIGFWNNSKLSLVTSMINKDLFDILKKYSKKDLNEILIISVINNKENKIIKDKLKKTFKCKITQIKSSAKLFGVINGYKKSVQLGDDRWVTIVASYLNYKKPLVIVDCGTALSIDCINDNGRHLGGYILSGFDGYSQSFYNAEKLKKIKLKENKTNIKLLYAKTTREALLAGYALMVTSAIEKTYSKVKFNSSKKPLLIMSGSYAKQILSNLNIKSMYDPNLVLKCLGFISDKK
jgi:type III pantothenate kinase